MSTVPPLRLEEQLYLMLLFDGEAFISLQEELAGLRRGGFDSRYYPSLGMGSGDSATAGGESGCGQSSLASLAGAKRSRGRV